jgi:carboxypeptidase PM20D1
MGFVKKLVLGLGLGVLGLGGAVGIKTATTPSRQLPVTTPDVAAFDEEAQLQLARRLGGALRIQTVSQEGRPFPAAELRALHAYLRESFPALHAALKLETVNELSLLYTWPGQEPAAKPYLLLAHQDVVPVEEGSGGRWTHPPFAGEVEGGFVWGRGAIDDKGSLMAILEAIELLVRSGYKPRRTIYLAFGHDEEITGLQGARMIARLLAERGVRLDYVLDEGMAITQGMVPGARQRVALVGLAEKGYLSLELSTRSTGGHSSLPPAHTAIGVLSRAVRRVEDHPFASAMRPPASQLFDYIGPDLAGPLRVLFTNMWLLGPVVRWQLGQQPSTAPLVRTTTAATLFSAGTKDNVLPQSARAVINFRVLPGDTTAQIEDRVRRLIDDPAVEVKPIPTSVTEPSPVADAASPSFHAIARTVRAVYTDTLVGPTLMLGQSDSRHYVAVADNTYRFQPVTLVAEDLNRVHGTDERIAVKTYADAVRFYAQLVHTCDREP